MPMTINVLWENKQYWVMLKVTGQKEFDLADLPKISLEKQIKQAQEIGKTIKDGVFGAISYLKSKMNSKPPKRDKDEEKRKNKRKYRSVNDYKYSRKNKKNYYKPQRVSEVV